MAKHYQFALAIIGLIIAMGIAGGIEQKDEQRQDEQYCRMVAMWKESGGEKGWPAYDGEEVCRDTQSNEKGAGGEQ